MPSKKPTEPLPVPVNPQEFRKANEIIAPRVARGGTLTLLGRKLFNVLLFHTQQLGSPGRNAPPGDTKNEKLYWLPLSDLAKDAAFNSEDTQLLKQTLVKLQDIKITTDNEELFSSDNLLPSVRVVPGKRGAKTMVGWGFTEATEEILKDPEFYTRLSIFYLTSLKTTAGIALYENCKRYVTNPSRLTRREPWEWWFDVLTGLPAGSRRPEFKYFNRDTLQPAIEEVNTTDIKVELLTERAGRKVTTLQFRVERKPQGSLSLPPPPVIDSGLINRIEALGLLRREAEDISAGHDEAFVKATLDLVEARALDSSLPPVGSLPALFRAALKGRYVDGQKKQKRIAKPAAVSEKPASPPVDPEVSKARKDKLKEFDGLAEDVQQRLLTELIQDKPHLAQFARKSVRSRIVRETLADWLMARKKSVT